ncbi:MAG: cytochrome P450 [Acidobacteriota bacterium]
MHSAQGTATPSSSTGDAVATATSPPPGPKPAPVLGWRGNALSFFKNPIATMRQLRADHGDVVRLVAHRHPPIFHQPSGDERVSLVFGFGPEANRAILTDTETYITSKPRGPKTEVADQLGQNILFMNGELHRSRRRMLMPAFTRDSLKSHHDETVNETVRTLAQWQNGAQVDVLAEMSGLTARIASRALLGLDPQADQNDIAVTMRRVVNSMFSPATLVPIDLPGTPFRRLRRDMETTRDCLLDWIARRRREGTESSDILAQMIAIRDEDGTSLSDDELVAQSFVLFFAGHDTTSCALTWTLFLLERHPDVLEALAEEVAEHLGDEPPAYEQLYALPLLDRVIKESLRLLPPSVMFPRSVARETSLLGHRLLPGDEVLFSPYITHQDASIYPDPSRFLPDRWIDRKVSAYEHLPFGAGPRRCLGGAFGAMQLRIIVPMVLQRWRYSIVPGTRIDPHVNVVMSPKGGLPVTVHQPGAQPKTVSRIGGYISEMVGGVS